MWPPSDDVLLAGFGMGDAQATAGFVRRYQARVFGLALSVLNDRALAEDVSQEVFLRAWRHAGSYDARKGSVPTWLLTITRNAAVDAMRIRRPEPVDPAVMAHLDVATSESSGPASRTEVTQEVSGLKAVLAGLPGEQRRALLLAAVCGRTAAEIAESEGIPLGTAKTRIRTGLMKVRGALASARGEWS
jgi:RNA polymerase sigma factor (sigma-70 family)